MKNKIIFLINKEMIIIEENIQNIKKNAEYINDIFENGVGSSVTIDMSNISGIQSSILIKTIKIDLIPTPHYTTPSHSFPFHSTPIHLSEHLALTALHEPRAIQR